MQTSHAAAETDLTSFRCCGLTRTDAVEDTLKVVLELSGMGAPVTTSAVASRLGVTPPTSSAMIKRLVEHGLLDHAGDPGLVLSDHGAGHARHILRRHRLMETFLVQVLQLPWDKVYSEAELLEHSVSDLLVARIDELLGHPTVDPHGDPIPRDAEARDADRHVESWGHSLDEVSPGTQFRVERIHNHDGEALRYMGRLGLIPGAVLDVQERDPFGGPLWVRLAGRRHALGEQLARLVHGTVLGPATAPVVDAETGQP